MSIGDENGHTVYDASGQIAFNPTWTLNKGNEQLATVKRKLLAWVPTWNIYSRIGDFSIKRKVFSWTRTYHVIGGQYDGAKIKGNFWDLKFQITHRNQCIASAQGEILSLRDTHSIQVHSNNSEDELFTSIVMVVLHRDREEDRRSASD
ncbi:hypothetical protein GCM10007391_16870 [Alteromonas halophila]|uniref:Uncharacterized protein n=2 Tax=Alteromonas halophila TaxID=516698 RepID=A0A918MXG8_9ALTE|nr:hypothetical protein GCM10007391_16870 [Alteromonas halophila]